MDGLHYNLVSHLGIEPLLYVGLSQSCHFVLVCVCVACAHVCKHTRMSDNILPTASSGNSQGGEMGKIVSGQEGIQLYLDCFNVHSDNTFMYYCVIKNK